MTLPQRQAPVLVVVEPMDELRLPSSPMIGVLVREAQDEYLMWLVPPSVVIVGRPRCLVRDRAPSALRRAE